MCGIAGFIGVSKNFQYSYNLITELFKSCVVRGKDASGFWGTEVNNGQILYHKEPIASPDFVKKSIWTDIQGMDVDMLLVHARGASIGVGSPHENKNNHPFVNEDRSIGLIHNGRIPDHEYLELCKKFETSTNCDSEILLRIFEAGRLHTPEKKQNVLSEPVAPDVMDRLVGASDVWAYIEKGHMAVAIGERPTPEQRRLMLFRNNHRSLWVVDLREDLGQIFFCSTAEIWREAYANTDIVLKSKFKLIEFPIQEIWSLETKAGIPDINLKKFKIAKEGMNKCDFSNVEKIKIPKGEPVAKVYTNLKENDTISYPLTVIPNVPIQHTPLLYENEVDWPNYSSESLSKALMSLDYLKSLVRTIQTSVEVGANTQRINEDEIDKITTKLRKIEKMMESITQTLR